MVRASILTAAAMLATGAQHADAAMLEPAGFEPRIVINEEAGAEEARKLGAPFESVVQLRLGDFQLCSGALISATTVLTARHCIDLRDRTLEANDLSVGFTDADGSNLQSFSVASIERFTAGQTDFTRGEFFDGSDLALIFLDDAVLDKTPFGLLAEPSVGEVARLVGYGDHGVAKEGQPTDRDGGYQGERWGAENVIDVIAPECLFSSCDPDFGASGDNSLIYTDFDSPSDGTNTLSFRGSDAGMIEAEGTTAPGDSGGPLLVQRGGEWQIAGILTGGSAPGKNWITYGDLSVWTGFTSPEAQGFVRAGGGVFAIPLPGAGWLLLSALGLVGALRARRRG